jgi:lysophospholipase L1-like esterase
MSILTVAFIVFGVIDLIFVGTTTFFVVKLVTKVLNEKSILEEIRKILSTLKKDNPRNFIERGQ